jgi:hypothetical protein
VEQEEEPSPRSDLHNLTGALPCQPTSSPMPEGLTGRRLTD